MKSKSLDLGYAFAANRKQNRSFDFVNLYKTTSETSASVIEKRTDSGSNVTMNQEVLSDSPKRERSPNKRMKKKKLEPNEIDISISLPNIDSPDMKTNADSDTCNESKVTSTPFSKHTNMSSSGKVKSIMKVTSVALTDTLMDESTKNISSLKPKKRNKSVSFVHEEIEEVVVKKTKSDDSMRDNKVTRQFKKVKKNRRAEKENAVDENQIMEVDEKSNSKIKNEKSTNINTPLESENQSSNSENVSESNKKKKKIKKAKKCVEFAESQDNVAMESTRQLPENTKKPKKKNHQEKLDSEEPAFKSRKKDHKPDVIAADLENLSIGDNTHTLTNLLDEMTVVDKEKRKKIKQNSKKTKPPKGAAKTEETEKAEEGQEKVKWSRRKWNKDTKAEASLDTTIVVDNLPLSLLFTYKKVLAEHFVKFGLIKNVGIAEVYPSEVSIPAFTTTVNFYSDGAAAQALEEDNTMLGGSRVRVKLAPPPTETTLVVRSYGALTTQCLSTLFNDAGRIRNIRHLVKGKHAMPTSFVEFDGPETVERAMKLATNAKIGGKKIYVSKFEVRTKKSKQKKTNENEGSDADQSEDAQD